VPNVITQVEAHAFQIPDRTTAVTMMSMTPRRDQRIARRRHDAATRMLSNAVWYQIQSLKILI